MTMKKSHRETYSGTAARNSTRVDKCSWDAKIIDRKMIAGSMLVCLNDGCRGSKTNDPKE